MPLACLRRHGAHVPVFKQAQTNQPRKSNMPQECSVRASSNTHSFESSGIVLLKEAKAVFLFTNLPTTQVGGARPDGGYWIGLHGHQLWSSAIGVFPKAGRGAGVEKEHATKARTNGRRTQTLLNVCNETALELEL